MWTFPSCRTQSHFLTQRLQLSTYAVDAWQSFASSLLEVTKMVIQTATPPDRAHVIWGKLTPPVMGHHQSRAVFFLKCGP